MSGHDDDFDEAAYLAANPDVAAAVRQGHVKSGLAHYRAFGMTERRDLRLDRRLSPLKLSADPSLNWRRRDRILANLELGEARELEIGPLASPLVRPSEGAIFELSELGNSWCP